MDKFMLVAAALMATLAAVRAGQKALGAWQKVLDAARESEEPTAATSPATNGARPREAEPVAS
jgi:hypothetical protein